MTGSSRRTSYLLLGVLVTVASALTIVLLQRSGALLTLMQWLLTPPRPTVILLILISVTAMAFVRQLAPSWVQAQQAFLGQNLGGWKFRRVLAAVAGIAITMSLLNGYWTPEKGTWRLLLILVAPTTVLVAMAELTVHRWVQGQYGARAVATTRRVSATAQNTVVSGVRLFQLTYRYLIGAVLMSIAFAWFQKQQPDALPSWAPLGPFIMLFMVWAFHTGRAQIRLLQLLNLVGFIAVRRTRPVMVSGIVHNQTYNAWEWRKWRTVWSIVVCALLYIMFTHRPWGLYAAVFLFLVWTWAFLAYRVQRVFGTNDDPADYKSLSHPVLWGFIPMGLSYLKWWPLRIPALFPLLIFLPLCFAYSEYENWSYLYSQGWFWILISVPMVYWAHYWRAAWPREGYGITGDNELVIFKPTIGLFPDSERLSADMKAIGQTKAQPNALGFAIRIVFHIRFISNRPQPVDPSGPMVILFVRNSFISDLRAAGSQAQSGK